MDGDGYDDFILTGARLSGDALDEGQPTFAYWFYGRPSFGEQLAAANADASFETPFAMGFKLGDVNGDGLADFVLKGRDAYEIVLGSNRTVSMPPPAGPLQPITWVVACAIVTLRSSHAMSNGWSLYCPLTEREGFALELVS